MYDLHRFIAHIRHKSYSFDDGIKESATSISGIDIYECTIYDDTEAYYKYFIMKPLYTMYLYLHDRCNHPSHITIYFSNNNLIDYSYDKKDNTMTFHLYQYH